MENSQIQLLTCYFVNYIIKCDSCNSVILQKIIFIDDTIYKDPIELLIYRTKLSLYYFQEVATNKWLSLLESFGLRKFATHCLSLPLVYGCPIEEEMLGQGLISLVILSTSMAVFLACSQLPNVMKEKKTPAIGMRLLKEEMLGLSFFGYSLLCLVILHYAFITLILQYR